MEQLELFTENQPLPGAPVMRSSLIDPDKILETQKWQEFHENGQIWIDGEVALIKDEFKDLYDYRTGFPQYEGDPVVRIGIWTKYFDNGQIAWQLDFGDGMYDSKTPRTKFNTQYRKDGTPIAVS